MLLRLHSHASRSSQPSTPGILPIAPPLPLSVTWLITVRSKRNNELSLMSIDIPNHMLAFMLSASQIPVTQSMLHPSSSHLFSPSLYLSIFPNTAASRLPVSHSYVTLLFWPWTNSLSFVFLSSSPHLSLLSWPRPLCWLGSSTTFCPRFRCLWTQGQ